MYGCCGKCGEFDFWGEHKCPPRWFVYDPDMHDKDDPVVVYAAFAEQAAEKAVQAMCEDDWETLSVDESLEVLVRPANAPPEAPWIKYEVTLTLEPRFDAELVEE